MIVNNNTTLNAGLPFGRPAFAFFGFALLVLSGCDPDKGTESTDFDRSAYLIHTADELIVPSYEEFASDASNLYDVFVGLESGTVTSENVIALREGLRTANISWQQAQLFDFGPAITLSLIHI